MNDKASSFIILPLDYSAMRFTYTPTGKSFSASSMACWGYS